MTDRTAQVSVVASARGPKGDQGGGALVDDTLAASAPTATSFVWSAAKVGLLLAAAMFTAADRTALANTNTANIARVQFEGNTWEQVAYSGVSSLVDADTAQAVYVQSAFNPAKAWVRRFYGPHNAKWFGMAGGGDALPAFLAIKSYFSALSNAGYYDAYPGTYRPFPKLFIPMSAYSLSGTFDADGGTWDIEAEAYGNQNGGNAVVFSVAPGCDGIVFQNWNTTGVNTAKTSRAQTYGASGSKMRNVLFRSTGAGSNPAACGIYVRTRVELDNCGAQGFPGDGLIIAASAGAGGAAEGNANNCKVNGGDYSSNGGCGIRCVGADANAVDLSGAINVSNNGQWGLRDSSFLGINPRAVHSATNGMTSSGPAYAPNVWPGQCHYAGNRYYLVIDQEAAASTTVPGTNNAVWGLLAVGGSTYYYPTWVTGQTWKSGGAYASTNPNAQTVFRDCYGEGDNAPAQLGPRGSWDGGIAACYVIGSLTQQLEGGRFTTGSSIGARAYGDAAHGTTDGYLGGGNPNNCTVFGSYNTLFDNVWGAHVLGYNSFYKDLIFGTIGNQHFRIATDATIFNPGRAAAFPGAVIFPSLFPGVDNAARFLTFAGAAPATPAGVGDLILNNSSATTKEIGWRCLTAGTPGVYETIYRRLYGSVVYDPPSLGTGLQQNTTVAVAGAVLGDIVSGISFSNVLSGTRMWGEVTAANTVTVYHRNDTGGTVDLASGTLRAEVVKQV